MAAAVDWNAGAGDEAGRVAREELDSRGNLLGVAGTAECMGRLRVLEELGVRLGTHAASLVQIGDCDARIDGVAADAFGGELEGDAAGELIDGGLREIVGQHSRERADPVDAGHVHDVPLRLHQVRNRQHRQMVHRPDVRVHHPVVLLQRGRLYRPRLQNAGVVYQHVQLPEPLNRLVYNALGVLFFGYVAGGDQMLAIGVDFQRQRLEIGEIAAVQR